MAKPFLEPSTLKKVTFSYPNNPRSCILMEELFDKDKLETYFGGKNKAGFNYEAYAQKMREDDQKMSKLFIDSGCSSSHSNYLNNDVNESQHSDDNDSEDETSGDEAVCSNLEEDNEIVQG
ncbi:putative CRAL-TRIO lipid binding domain-containing protein [Lupinus albus]|uniref:Putative CRAL-TRIO lipid binding domain-containing protein n=1 Tax=Lupinus albus TaxID=3870 RepID=A0A6A4NMV0_LUPAL|nr:putative CRAL-TRIO lipid binding domain-containing protein [Lupinus albus]